jgi:hypothetical protein
MYKKIKCIKGNIIKKAKKKVSITFSKINKPRRRRKHTWEDKSARLVG